jgi:Sulfotransferase family
MTMPNFLVIGAMKSGTTALYYYLAQHPEIYMSPVKEPNFFCSVGQASRHDSSVAHLETYESLFEDVSGEKAIGEASHCYLYEPKAVARIQQYLPDAKFVAILRDPVDRAYSHFLHMVRNGTEPLTDFAEALVAEEARACQDRRFQDYVGRGLYYDQLRRYFDVFGRERVKVFLYEDLSNVPISVLQNTFRFLEVDDSIVPDVSLRRNISGSPRYKVLDSILRKPNPVKDALKTHLPAGLRWRLSGAFDELKTRNLTRPPAVEPGVRRRLGRIYREDILKVQGLIHRDLSEWLE